MSRRVGVRAIQGIPGKRAVAVETGWHTRGAKVVAASPAINLSRVFERTCTDHVRTGDMSTAPTIRWTYTAAAGGMRSIAVADIDQDGECEVIVYAGGRIYCLDKDGNYEWDYQVYASYPDGYGSVTLADVDGDGDLEILCVGLDSAGLIGVLYCLNSNGSEKWHFDLDFESDWQCPVVIDVDEDGEMEILVGDVSNCYSVKHTGVQEWAYTDGTIWAWGPIAVADIDNDGNLEIVVPHDWEAVSGGVYFLKPDGTSKQSPYIDNIDHDWCALYDIDNDNQMEIIIAGDSTVKILNSDGSFRASYTAGNSVYFQIGVADIDGDGYAEIMFACINGLVYCIEHDATFKWSRDAQYGAWVWRNDAGVIVVDIDGDGNFEILRLTSGTVNSREMDCVDKNGNLQWYYAEIGGGYPERYTCVGWCVEDVDQDGKLEIFNGLSNGVVRCFEA